MPKTMKGVVVTMPNLDRFAQDYTPVYPPEAFIPVCNPRLEKEAEIMSMATAAVMAIENARSAVDEMLNYLDITINKSIGMRVLVRDLRDLDQIPGEVEISNCEGEGSFFTHKAEKEFEGVVFLTYLQDHELQCPLEHSV